MERGNQKTRGLERQLRQEVREFMHTIVASRLKPHNRESILLRLTGSRFDDLTKASQVKDAQSRVETALMRERKRARMKHREYDLNRHIALHQAKKSLEEWVPIR